jgi:DNA-binding MarR family transcriptional regulator
MDRIEDCISFQLGKAYQQVNQLAKKHLAPFGVTPVQYALLKVLWERDGQRGAELGERLRLDAATITGVLDRLEQAGLTERRAHAVDRRVNQVFLTVRGRAVQAALDSAMDQLNAEVFARVGDDDAARLQALLRQLGAGEELP